MEYEDQHKSYSRTKKVSGVLSRNFRRYMGRNNQEPFSWVRSFLTFNAGKKGDPITFNEGLDKYKTTMDTVIKNREMSKKRGVLYCSLSVIFLVVLIVNIIVGGGAALGTLMFASIPVMLASFGVRYLFWSYQLSYGMSHPDEQMASFSSYIKNPEVWI